jgi:16S rRNA processing protein RimM
VIVARIGAAHGVAGEVRLWSFTEDPLAIAEYGPLETQDGERRLQIESLRPAKDCLIARFEGVADRAQAEALRNFELFVPRERLPAIEEDDTFYVSDLVGLDAVASDGNLLGTVTAVHNFGAGDIIEIAPRAGGPTLLLPFTGTTVPEVDLNGGKIVMVMPEESGEADSDSSPPPLRGGRRRRRREGE